MTSPRLFTGELPIDPTPQQIDAFARVLAAHAIDMAAPGRSIASTVQHRLGGHSLELQARVRCAARQAMADAAQGERATQYTGISGAAETLGIDAGDVRRLLMTLQGRRSLGFPVHVGCGEFRIPRAALDATRGQFLADLPREEPPHPVPLPAGYQT